MAEVPGAPRPEDEPLEPEVIGPGHGGAPLPEPPQRLPWWKGLLLRVVAGVILGVLGLGLCALGLLLTLTIVGAGAGLPLLGLGLVLLFFAFALIFARWTTLR